MTQCLLCAGELVDLDGFPCECSKEITVFEGFGAHVCTFIPQQYQGIIFDKSLLPTTKSGTLPGVMQEIFEDAISRRLINTNILLTSPVKTGKTVLAYSAIQQLFSKGVPIFPYLDVLEIRRIMKDIDDSKEYLYKDETSFDIQNIYKAPILFVKIPVELDNKVCDAISILTDRRTRRGHSTIYFSQHSWETIAKVDYNHTFKSLIGDGAFGTIKNYNFW